MRLTNVGSEMYREAVTEVELVILITYAFSECSELDGDCDGIRIAGVQRYPVDPEKDCNWDTLIFNGPQACELIFRKIVDEFRSKYNLKTPDTA